MGQRRPAVSGSDVQDLDQGVLPAGQAGEGPDQAARSPGRSLKHPDAAALHRRQEGPHLYPSPGRGAHGPRRERGQGVLCPRRRPRRPPYRPQRQKGPLAQAQRLALRTLRRLKYSVSENERGGAESLAPFACPHAVASAAPSFTAPTWRVTWRASHGVPGSASRPSRAANPQATETVMTSHRLAPATPSTPAALASATRGQAARLGLSFALSHPLLTPRKE